MPATDEKSLKMFSSYTVLMVESILGQFKIPFDNQTLEKVLENEESIYFIVCKAPMRNIINELIAAQIKSYQNFIQKKLVDYFANNPPTVDEDAPGDIESYYPQTITEIKQRFLEAQSTTQTILQVMFDIIAQTNQIIFTHIHQQMVHQGHLDKLDVKKLNEELNPVMQHCDEIKQQLISEREHWRKLAADYSKNLSAVSIFQMNEIEDLELRSELNFYSQLGSR